MRLAALAIAALSACGSTAPPPHPPVSGGHLPPPFSAADLRANLPAGTEIELRIEAAGRFRQRR